MSTVTTGPVHHSETAPYVGIGASLKPATGFAIRLEYEVIDSDFGNPTTTIAAGFVWGR
jgi:hypothetical protein